MLLRSLPRSLLWREALLAALPGALTVVLLGVALMPTTRSLAEDAHRNQFAYQGLVSVVHTYEVLSLTPGVSEARLRESYETALASASNPSQFTGLADIERNEYGPARLSRVEALLREDTPDSRREAAVEVMRLQAQAFAYARDITVRIDQALRWLRNTLLVTALMTGVLSMLLTLRALMLWRAERERQTRRDERQREALRLANHELRRPLQALLLASDLLRQADTEETRLQLLSLIEDSTTQLAARADLTRLNDLYLDVSLRLQPTDLRELARYLAGPRVHVDLPEEPLVWSVDPDRVRQILENLVENALRYTEGPVEVTLGLVDGRPHIDVRDYGPGLSPAMQERAFLPYERGPRGLNEGSGLGLSLARRYARAHGGDVTLHAAPGEDGGLVARVELGRAKGVVLAAPVAEQRT